MTLWKTFLDSIPSSVSDYLSIEHLCLILRRLADHSKSCLSSMKIQVR